MFELPNPDDSYVILFYFTKKSPVCYLFFQVDLFTGTECFEHLSHLFNMPAFSFEVIFNQLPKTDILWMS